MFKRAGLVFAILASSAAAASDPINAGDIRNVAFRSGYVLFKVFAGSANQCAPCPADPGLYASGGYCWIADTAKTQLSMLLLTKAQEKQIAGRVTDISTNCSMYQTVLVD